MRPRYRRSRQQLDLSLAGLFLTLVLRSHAAEPVPVEIYTPLRYEAIRPALAVSNWEDSQLRQDGSREAIDFETHAFAVAPGFFVTVAPTMGATIQTLSRPEWTLPAREVTRAPETDLCLIKVDVQASGTALLPLDPRLIPPPGMRLLTATLGRTLLEGVLAGRDREYGLQPLPFTRFRTRFEDLDRDTSHGAPILSEDGRVLGIHTGQRLANTADAHTIPAAVIAKMMADYKRTGQFTPIRIGAKFKRDATLPEIIEVTPESPAAVAGLRPQDIVLSAGSEPVLELADLVDVMKTAPVGTPITLVLLRERELMTVELLPIARNP